MRIPAPNFTQTPNDLFDHWLPHLKEVELKVILVIMRKTFGWHRIRDRISLSQLEQMTGASRTNILSAIKSLIQIGLIKKEVIGKVGRQETHYELVVQEDSNNSYQSQFSTGRGDNLVPGRGDNLSPTKERVNKTKDIIASDPEPEKIPDKPKSEDMPAGGNNNKFPAYLENCTDLSSTQKKQLSKYDPKTLEKAVKYTYHPSTKLEGPNARIKQLHAFCKNPDAYEDALKQLDNPKQTKHNAKDIILQKFKKGNSYKGFTFNIDEIGVGFTHPNGIHDYSITWKEKDFTTKWNDLLKKLGLDDLL